MDIVLDAGHGGFDNGASYGGRLEKNENLMLTLAVGQKLMQDGYKVYYTRDEDIYQSPYEKAQIANEKGADYFISFHRNDSLEDDQYNGIQSLIYNDASPARELAQNIDRELELIGFNDLGIEERPGLVVLRRTEMPAVLVEVGFINSKVDNQIFDERFNDIVDAIVSGIEQTIPIGNEPIKMPVTATSDTHENEMYGIQTGVFKYRNNAVYLAQELKKDGYKVNIMYMNELYYVRVIEIYGIEDAKRIQKELQLKGYDTLIVKM